MSQLKSFFIKLYIFWKTRKGLKKLKHTSVSFPLPSTHIENVLILLPEQADFVDAALTLIRHVRQYFPDWHFMILDINKIPEKNLDKFRLPTQEFIDDLQKSHFQLAVNLNFHPNKRIDYLIVRLEIPYRLCTLKNAHSEYYNMFAKIEPEAFTGYHHVLVYLKSTFVKV
jgi:hypothetical protein